jgi:hypothetical protein
MRYTLHLAVAICAVLAGPQQAEADRRVALVIGNSTYRHTAVLRNPRSDAEAIAKLLGTNGFEEVLLKTDLDYSSLRRAARRFGESAKNSDVALVYYAGHGLEIAGTNYLVPVDAKLARDVDLEYEAVTLESVLSAVSGARRLKLVILDACRNNPLANRMALRAEASRSVKRGLARIEPRGEVLVAYAAKAGTVAADGVSEHSPYTAALLKHLATPGLDVLRMLGRVKEEVVATTSDQEPWIYGSPGGDSIALVPAKVVPSTTAAPSGPASDELAWDLVKDTKDPELVRRFIKQFPQSSKRAEAEKRASNLAAQPPSAIPPAAASKGPSRSDSKCFTFQGRRFCE